MIFKVVHSIYHHHYSEGHDDQDNTSLKPTTDPKITSNNHPFENQERSEGVISSILQIPYLKDKVKGT